MMLENGLILVLDIFEEPETNISPSGMSYLNFVFLSLFGVQGHDNKGTLCSVTTAVLLLWSIHVKGRIMTGLII